MYHAPYMVRRNLNLVTGDLFKRFCVFSRFFRFLKVPRLCRPCPGRQLADPSRGLFAQFSRRSELLLRPSIFVEHLSQLATGSVAMPMPQENK